MRRDHSFTDEPLAHPVDEPPPEFPADQDYRNLAALSGLNQRQAFGELVDRAESARQHDVRRRKADEHHLAREKVSEVDADILILVARLLVRQHDVEPYRGGASRVRAVIGGLHQAWSASGNHREAGVGEKAGDAFRLFIVGMSRADAGAPEHADGGPDIAQLLRCDREFCHNAEHPPRFLAVGRIRRLGIDQLRDLARLNHLVHAHAGFG